MKASIMCNGINWTIKKNTIYNTSRIKCPHEGKATEKI